MKSPTPRCMILALAMPERPDRRTREVQAESVAYAVCQHYGLDTSDYSFGYIAGWSSGKELAELKGSLETIRSTAASLIDTIDGHFAEIQKAQDKEQTTEQAQTRTGSYQTARSRSSHAGASRRNSPGTGKRNTAGTGCTRRPLLSLSMKLPPNVQRI